MDVELAPVIVDGESLTIEKVVAVARYDAPVKLSESCYEGYSNTLSSHVL